MLSIAGDELLVFHRQRLDELFLAAVGVTDCRFEVVALDDDQFDVVADCDPQVVAADDIRRVGHRDEHGKVVEEAKGERAVAPSELLREELRCAAVELDRLQIEKGEARLLGQGLGDRAAGRPAAVDHDFTEASSARRLVEQGRVELVRRQGSRGDEQSADLATSTVESSRQGIGEPQFHSGLAYRHKLRIA